MYIAAALGFPKGMFRDQVLPRESGGGRLCVWTETEVDWVLAMARTVRTVRDKFEEATELRVPGRT